MLQTTPARLTTRLTQVTVLILTGWVRGLALEPASVRIISPANGVLVRPGEVVTVAVESSGEALQGVIVLSSGPIAVRESLVGPPYKLTMEIPRDIEPGGYNFTAAGYTAAGHEVKQDVIAIDVEREDSPVGLSVAASTVKIHVGQVTYFDITGAFADGTSARLTKSSLTKFSLDDPGIASLGPYGRVSNGKASVTAIVKVLRDDEDNFK